jgi:hypothetical protein
MTEHYDKISQATKDIESFLIKVNEKKGTVELYGLYIEILKSYGFDEKFTQRKLKLLKHTFPNLSVNLLQNKISYVGE